MGLGPQNSLICPRPVASFVLNIQFEDQELELYLSLLDEIRDAAMTRHSSNVEVEIGTYSSHELEMNRLD
ncbi:unnamed protein product [Protopolystoma xenopodis]|uniref:Uncharacterized protein n=1 Tax=Protopolystoma xenopodis TaxID=117903 RepID=A0A448WY93_9PLAT|nr:unnamed protein product [Protopolystoma xenopodis]